MHSANAVDASEILRWQRFYYPGQDLADSTVQDQLTAVVDRRTDKVEITPDLRLSGTELVIAESLYLGFDVQSIMRGVGLSLEDNRLREISAGVNKGINGQLHAVAHRLGNIGPAVRPYKDIATLGVVPRQSCTDGRDMHQERGNGVLHIPDAVDEVDLLLSGAVLSANAHKNHVRQSGGSYFQHPRAVADLIGLAASRFADTNYGNHGDVDQPARSINRKDVIIMQFLALVHDTFEDVLQKDGGSFLKSDEFIVSPLLVRQLLRGQGVGIDTSDQCARSLLWITASRLPNGQHGPYEQYAEDVLGLPITGTVKVCDMHHNTHLDPKPAAERMDPKKAALQRAKKELQGRLIAKALSKDTDIYRLPEHRWLYQMRSEIVKIDTPDLQAYQANSSLLRLVGEHDLLF